jgi:uncharacterized protein YjiS (DUF1127 family)
MIRSDELASLRPARGTRRSLLAAVIVALRVKDQRARLAKLDDHLLHDIGLTRAEAEMESERPFWDAPTHWRR